MISLTLFTADKEAKNFAADMSELSFGRALPVFERVYSDACDLGIELYNNKTGNSTWWVVEEENKDAENELVSWTLIPMPGSVVRFPTLKGWTVTIYND